MDQIVRSYAATNAFMGTVLVSEGDHVLLDQGYGSADLEWNIPNAPDTRLRIASLTKQFTAALVLLLQQDGMLNIKDPVSKYLPEAPQTWQEVTLAELMGNTSGIPDFTDFKEMPAWGMTSHTVDEELSFFKNKPLDFEPGSQWAYSSSGFEVLGAVIEEVTGTSYGDQLQARIFGPLEMKNTGLDVDGLILSKRAQGYRPGTSGLLSARSLSMSVPWAAGSMYSTARDLLKWEHALFGGQLLNKNSLKLMTTPGKGSYGLGVYVTANKTGTTIVTHGGTIAGFKTSLSYVPDRRIAVVVLSNVEGAAASSIADRLLTVALDQ
jgi:CubicO group peptidase (beta-lactamase class C family)